MPFEVPVGLFIFNRPELTRRLLDRLRPLQPAHLLVVADGPRPGEEQLCSRARQVLEAVDWPCRLERHFSGLNLGAGRCVSGGLGFIFDRVEEAVLLEDDCLPDPSFFPFCAELLERYREVSRVTMICGYNPFGTWRDDHESYHFSRTGSHWGWASWRRAWSRYDYSMAALQDPDLEQRLLRVTDPVTVRNRLDICARVARGQIDTWDCQWTLMQLLEDGLAAVSSRNLIENVGFGPTATHTRQSLALCARTDCRSQSFPLRHGALEPDALYDQRLLNWRLGRPDSARILAGVDLQLAAGRHAPALLLLEAGTRNGLLEASDQAVQERRQRALAALRR